MARKRLAASVFRGFFRFDNEGSRAWPRRILAIACPLLEAGGAIYVEQLDDGSVEIRDELPRLKPSLV